MPSARTDASNVSPPVARRGPMQRRRSVVDVLTQFVLPLVGLSFLVFAGWFVMRTRPVLSSPPPPIEPAHSPYADTLAAAGIVEAQTENIAVGSPTPGVVVEVLVQVGDNVMPGQPLFRLDDRQLQGELAVRRANIRHAKSELIRLEAEPRKEKVPVIVAEVNEAKSLLVIEKDALSRAEETFARRVTTEQDVMQKRNSVAFAQANVEKHQADLELLQAGSWQYDRDVADAAVGRAESEAGKIEIEIDRLVVRALVAGRVLQVNVRPGEFVGAPPGQPLVVLGNVDKLHVRVDVDEFDIPRFHGAAAATAVPRGNLQSRYPLQFVRVEPFVVPKKSLTGDNTERVDTRVLQVIYEFDPVGLPPLFVGQQVEVFIDAAQSTADDAGPRQEAG